MTIKNQHGQQIQATYVRHLRTHTPLNSMGGRNIDVDLYRLDDGLLVVTRWDNDGRHLPVIDVESTPADYGVAVSA